MLVESQQFSVKIMFHFLKHGKALKHDKAFGQNIRQFSVKIPIPKRPLAYEPMTIANGM